MSAWDIADWAGLLLLLLWAFETGRWLRARRVKSDALPVAPPAPPFGDLQPYVDKVRFDKTCIGEGFTAQRLVEVRHPGKPTVWVMISSEPPKGQEVSA